MKQKRITGSAMIAAYLVEHQYDGLFCEECCCDLADLMPCGGDWAIDCAAGYKHKGCAEHPSCKFHIRSTKP